MTSSLRVMGNEHGVGWDNPHGPFIEHTVRSTVRTMTATTVTTCTSIVHWSGQVPMHALRRRIAQLHHAQRLGLTAFILVGVSSSSLGVGRGSPIFGSMPTDRLEPRCARVVRLPFPDPTNIHASSLSTSTKHIYRSMDVARRRRLTN